MRWAQSCEVWLPPAWHLTVLCHFRTQPYTSGKPTHGSVTTLHTASTSLSLSLYQASSRPISLLFYPHDTGSICPNRFTPPGSLSFFLEYGRCLHSTYLRWEVRAVGPKPDTPPKRLPLHHSLLSTCNPPTPPLKLPETSLENPSVHLYLDYVEHNKRLSAKGAASGTETTRSESLFRGRLHLPDCARPEPGIPYMRHLAPRDLACDYIQRNGSLWEHPDVVMLARCHRLKDDLVEWVLQMMLLRATST